MTRPVNFARILVAFVAATAVALLSMPVMECAEFLVGAGRLQCGASLVPTLLIGSFFAVPVVAVFAFPLFLILWRFRLLAFWQIVLGAVGSSLAALAALSIPQRSIPAPGDLALFCYIGASAGIVFWLVGIRGNEP